MIYLSLGMRSSHGSSLWFRPRCSLPNARKNDNTKYYMVLQGILRACGQRSGFLANTLGRLQESGRDVPCEEFTFVLNSEYANYLQLQEHIMGSMKSLQPDKDMPFDAGGFILSGLSKGKSEEPPGARLTPGGRSPSR